jgi:hypothetical protein
VDELPEPLTGQIPQLRPGELRASDADRDRVADLLREALAEGRLSLVEHAERIDAVYRSKTLGELEPLTRDLPYVYAAAASGTSRQLEPSTVPRTLSRPQVTAPLVAVFGETKRRGAWVVGPEVKVTAVFGSVRLDFCEAVFQQQEVVVVANAVFGSVRLTVPDGIEVRPEGVAIGGGFDIQQPAPPVPGAPVIRVRGVGVFASVECKRPRRLRLGELRRGRWPVV